LEDIHRIEVGVSADENLKSAIITDLNISAISKVEKIAQEGEKFGYDSIWSSDHFFLDDKSEERNCMEAWTLLSALAVATKKIRLGTLVTCNSYRYPAVLAKIAATVAASTGAQIPTTSPADPTRNPPTGVSGSSSTPTRLAFYLILTIVLFFLMVFVGMLLLRRRKTKKNPETIQQIRHTLVQMAVRAILQPEVWGYDSQIWSYRIIPTFHKNISHL